MSSSKPSALPGGRGIYEVRFYGRGGQGTVSASVLLAEAAFREGRGVQAFPFFGVERRGAPVVAHTRIGERAIRLACDVDRPDALIVMDPSLITTVAGPSMKALRPGGFALFNSLQSHENIIQGDRSIRVVSFDASSIARNYGLGSPASPIVNTVVLGAFARQTGIISWSSLRAAIEKKVPAKTSANVAAAEKAYRSEDFH